MKRLLFLLLLSVPSFAACTITTFVSGTTISAAPMNANFASLNTCKPQRFTGTILPGNISGSLRGDIYTNTATNQAYICFAVGPCTAVAPGNWVLLGSGGGGGTGTVTVVGSGSLTSTGCVTGGGTTTIQTGTGCTISSTGDMVAHSYASSDTTHSGGSLYNGLTSGSVMLAAADVAGTAIVYVLPSTNGTSGQFLKDNGVVACPTLAAGSPSVCHQLTWATGSGGATIPSTTSALKGDGAGNALAVTGTGTDCVLVNGSSGACGGGGSGTVTSVGLTGTANQITVTGSSPITTSGSFALSIPTSPTLPGTTTGTFSGNLTGTVTGHATLDAPIASPTFTGTVTIPNGGVFGTPTSMTATNVTGLPVGGLTGLGTGVATALGSAVSGTGAICLASGSSCSGGGGSCGLCLVEQHTASSSATLDFTTCITSTYDEYQIELVNVKPATNAVSLWWRASTNGGSTYDTSSIYDYTGFRFNSTGNAVNGSTTAQAQIIMDGMNGGDFVSNSATYGLSGTYKLFSPLSTSVNKILTGSSIMAFASTSAQMNGMSLTSAYTSTTAVNAFRILFSSGNIASGTVRCYGVAK